jgi:uncharacterized protein
VTKILFFLIIGIAVYLLLGKRRAARTPRPGRAGSPSSTATGLPEAMVSCAYCGLHIPTSESLKIEGRHYCGEEHRRLDVGSTHP